jgi:hypothetical protein
MYHLTESHRFSEVLVQEGPALAAALLVSELLYKFHSFTLECVAFLGTWYALSRLIHAAAKRG